MKFNVNKFDNFEVDRIDFNDYPDFVDAYITEAEYDGHELTEDELDELNENEDIKYRLVYARAVGALWFLQFVFCIVFLG